jgi:hypothetical protein
MIANFMQLPYNFKPAKLILCIAPTNFFILYEMFHARVPNRLLKGLQFIAAALSEQFHPSIAQVPNRARHLEPTGNLPDAVPKPDALHPA